MRIIAGEFRSRRLFTPPDAEVTRPIPDRVKESLFSLLRGHFEDAAVFDGFAGTGAIGLEAVSRGAASCVLVEQDRNMVELLRQNVEMLGCGDRCEVFAADALGAGALARAPRPLTLAFLDPPYPLMQDPIGFRRVMAQLSNLIELLTPSGFAVLRSPWPLLHEVPDPNRPAPTETQRRDVSRKDRHSQVKKERSWRRYAESMDPARAAEHLSGARRSRDAQSPVPPDGPAGAEPMELPEDAASALPRPEKIEPDLRLPNAVGPETHTYQTMAIHLYMKKQP